MADKKLYFPTDYVSMGEAITTVKFLLGDDSVDVTYKLHSIQRVAEMPTLNSVTKDELHRALLWIFEHYEFPKEG